MITELILKELVPGLNGKDGLMRENWHNRKKKKHRYQILFMEQTRAKHKGKVAITYVRYACRLMDWDNHCASFKYLGDALVAAGIIIDDDPGTIIEFLPRQIKVNTQKEEIMVIFIEDLD